MSIFGSLLGGGLAGLGGLLGDDEDNLIQSTTTKNVRNQVLGPLGLSRGVFDFFGMDPSSFFTMDPYGLGIGIGPSDLNFNRKGELRGVMGGPTADLSARFQRAASTGEISRYEDQFNNVIGPLIAATGLGRLADFDSRFGQLRNDQQGLRDDLAGILASGTSQLSNLGNDARAAIEQNYADSTRQAADSLGASLSSRGLGSSSALESGLINDILPATLGAKLNALASVENTNQNLLAQRLGQVGSLLGQSILGEQNTLASGFNQRQGLAQNFADRGIAAAAAPIDFRANALVQPSVIYPNPQLANRFALTGSNASAQNTGMSGSQNLGGMLSSFGGLLLGNSFDFGGGFGGNLFGGGGGSLPYVPPVGSTLNLPPVPSYFPLG